MRKQTRPPIPEVLQTHGERWTRQWIELREKNPSAKFSWYQVEGKTAREWLLPQVNQMTQGHCAFCDCFPPDDRSREPIEHFQPKSDPRFYAEAYAWDNLYYCCDCCQSSKGERWDDRLLRPDAADYAFDRYFMFDYTSGQIKANCRASALDQARATVTIEFYGLDLPARRRSRQLYLRLWQDSRNPELDDFAQRDFLDPANDA